MKIDKLWRDNTPGSPAVNEDEVYSKIDELVDALNALRAEIDTLKAHSDGQATSAPAQVVRRDESPQADPERPDQRAADAEAGDGASASVAKKKVRAPGRIVCPRHGKWCIGCGACDPLCPD